MDIPTKRTVQALQHWLDDAHPISDSGARYLENDEIRSTWTRRKWFRFEREPRGLVSLDHDRTSPLNGLLRKIGYIFTVRFFSSYVH